MRYTIGIEKDDRKYRIVIRRADGGLIGVPLSNVDKKTAGQHLKPLSYAFEYGREAMKTQFIENRDYFVISTAEEAE